MNQSTAASTPDQIVARQARMARALQELAMFRYIGSPRVVPEPALPIADDEVKAWVDEHPFVRSTLAPHVARSLAYIARFRPRRQA